MLDLLAEVKRINCKKDVTTVRKQLEDIQSTVHCLLDVISNEERGFPAPKAKRFDTYIKKHYRPSMTTADVTNALSTSLGDVCTKVLDNWGK